MKNTFLAIIAFSAIAIGLNSCSKASTNNNNTNTTTESQVLTDFADNLVNPNYQDIQAKASIMNDAVTALVANTTDANLTTTRTAWKNTRAAWESCEGFLFGPVED